MKKAQPRARDNQKLRHKHRALRTTLPVHGELNLPNFTFSMEQIMETQYGIRTSMLDTPNIPGDTQAAS